MWQLKPVAVYMEVQFFVCFPVFIPALHCSLPYFSIDVFFSFICLLPRLVLTTATLRRRSRLWREYAFYPVMILNGMTWSRFGAPAEGSSGTTSAWRQIRSLSRLVLGHWMTPKLSSCYRKNSLNAAVLTQQQPLLSGGAHSQTQAGNTNASPPQRARSKVHVTLETVVPSLPSALHRKDRLCLPGKEGHRDQPLLQGAWDWDCLSAWCLGSCVVVSGEGGWVGWLEPRDPFDSFSLSVVYLYVPFSWKLPH